MLNRAIARGELPPEVDDELLPDLLLGPLWFRILVTGAPVTPEDARSVVRVVSTASHPARRTVRRCVGRRQCAGAADQRTAARLTHQNRGDAQGARLLRDRCPPCNRTPILGTVPGLPACPRRRR
jgi:hypothetical protein